MELSLQSVTTYGETGHTRPVLNQVTCTFLSGQITLVIGQTGAGKSTLLRIAAGLEPPAAGMVRYGETNVWQDKAGNAMFAMDLGFVFQYPEHQLFAKSVEAEFAYSLKPYGVSGAEGRARIRTALEQMGLDETLLAQSPLSLSGGQKRRVALATTLATRPRWLLLDEPTAGLDANAARDLLQVIQERRLDTQGGVIIATHDLDTFLPIADRVLVMQRGCIVAEGKPEWLCAHPEVLESCCVGLPACVQAAADLRAAGWKVPPGLYTPRVLAERMMEAGYRPAIDASAAATEAARGLAAANPDTLLYTTSDGDDVDSGKQKADCGQALADCVSRLQSMDARAKWLCYVMLSVAILLQRGPLGMTLATGVTMAVLLAARIPFSQYLRVIRPFGILMLMSVALSGLRFHPSRGRFVAFMPGHALTTFDSLYKLLLVMSLGGALAYTTSQIEMKRGVECGLAGLNKVKFPVAAFALGTTLVMRFIPVILNEVRRFAVIVKARGKARVRPGRVRFRDLPALVIPLLLSMFQFGEDISMAMEARGYTQIQSRKPTNPAPPFRRADWTAVAASLCLFVGMWVLARF